MDAFIFSVTCLDQDFHNGAHIVWHILVRKDAADIAFAGLAGKYEICRPLDGRVPAVESIHLHQKAQVLPGFQ